jgi:hypothetical protein
VSMKALTQPRFCLLLALIVFLFVAARSRPVESFGRYHDDTLYFSSAKALAAGRGYTMPSVPGAEGAAVAQTKYPVLYPWLLSWVWKWRPEFPQNLVAAVWLSRLFACWFLIVAFEVLRRLKGVGDWAALGIVALCALQPFVRIVSGAVLSDMPFMALALTAMLLADSGPIAAAAVAAGLATMTRGFGIAVAAGIVAFAIYRRQWRRAMLFATIAAPFVAASMVRWGGAETLQTSAGTLGWQQTALFYTSYWGFWKWCVPDVKVLGAMVSANLQEFLLGPSSYCLFPPLGGDGSYLGLLLAVTLTVGIFSGIVRQARSDRWRPIHLVFVFYSGLTLTWNYGIMNRFLLLFLPLFFAGAWIEGKHLASGIAGQLRLTRATGPRAVTAMLAVALAVLAGLSLREYAGWLRPPSERGARAALLEEKKQAYEWIRRTTDPGARLIAYEDVSLYLYTGRQALRPIAFSTEAFYAKNEKILEQDLVHITDVARHIGASYWLVSADDFQMEAGLSLVEKRMSELKGALPAVFRSSGDKVQLYDVSCLARPEASGCGALVTALLPPK